MPCPLEILITMFWDVRTRSFLYRDFHVQLRQKNSFETGSIRRVAIGFRFLILGQRCFGNLLKPPGYFFGWFAKLMTEKLGYVAMSQTQVKIATLKYSFLRALLRKIS